MFKRQKKQNLSSWKYRLIKILSLIFLFQTTLNFYSTPQTYAATPNAPTINNLNDGSGTTDTTPTFSFDISDPDGLDVLSYTLEIEEAGEDFTTPLVTKTGSLVSNTSEIIAAGDAHTIALKSDGTVWTWGDNSFGQLGDGTTTDHETALQISGLENVTQVAVGAYHTVVLKADGTVWAWGNNTYGQLGDNSNTHRYEPVQVNNLTDVIEIGAGLYHTFAVKSDGTLWAWGDNYYGQLGDGTTDERITPVQITTLTNITKVSAGEYHSIALKSDGTVWAWGDNYYGQIGDGTDIERDTPVQVNGLSGIDDIVAGVNHSLALKSDGTVWSWGNNSDGQLGDNSTTQRDEPVQVSGLTNVSNIAAGALHSIALTQSGVVLTWGDNLYGQLGDGTNTQKNVPTELSSISEVIQITAGSADSVVVKSDGTVWAWGNNDGGALGNNTTTHSNTPVQSLTSTLDPFFIKTDAQEYLGVTDTLETSLELGDYIWRVSVTDLAENQSPWTTASTGFSIISEGSNTAPNTPVILNYNNGASVNDTTPSLEFSLSDPDQSDPGENLKYQLQIDNNADFVSPEVNYTEIDFSSAPRNNVVFTASILSEGQYFWRVKAIDDEDLESSWQTATNGFIIDTSLPVSTIYYPQDNSTLKKVERIFGQSTDNNGVNYTRISVRNLSTQLYYNGSTFGSETEVWLETLGETSGAETTQWHYILSGWEDEKSYTIRSRATDMAGNEEHTDTVTFTYNTSEGETGSIYVSNPTVMNNSNYKIYYPNTAEIPTDADFEIDFDDNFTFSPWLNEEDIELSDQGWSISASTVAFDRSNKIITNTITSGSVVADDIIEMEINNLRIHNPSATGSYLLSIKIYNSEWALIEEGTGSITLVKNYQQVEINISVGQSLQISVDSGAVLLNVDPDVQFGQNWVGTGGTVSERTAVEVKTNAQNGYNLLISLAGKTASWSAVLDGITSTGSQITSSSGDRVSTENNFSFSANTGTAATVTAFQNSPTTVLGAGSDSPTNSFIDYIYYYLNVDYNTPADTYQGTITYTVVGSF